MGALRVVAGLFGLIAWLFFLGLGRVWHRTFGWLFETMADLLDQVKIPIPHHRDIHLAGPLSSWLRSLDKNVSHLLAQAALGAERQAVWLFSRLRFSFQWVRREIEGLAGDVFGFAWRLVTVEVPRFVRRLFGIALRAIHKLGKYARALGRKLLHELPKLWKGIRHALRYAYRHLKFLRKWAAAVLNFHWRIIKAIQKRIRGLEHLLVPKKFRALVYAALGGLGILWLLTDNVIQIGKWIGTLDKDAIWEWVKNEVRVAPQRNICELNALAYDVALYVVEPVIRKEIAILTWICQPDENDLPYGCEFPSPYKGAWEPYGTPPENDAMTEKRLAPGLPLPAGVIQA